MKTLIGFVLMILGCACICAGVYVGIWHWLVGGIIALIEQAQADKVDAAVVAWAIVKVILFELPTAIGGIFGSILLSLGWVVVTDPV